MNEPTTDTVTAQSQKPSSDLPALLRAWAVACRANEYLKTCELSDKIQQALGGTDVPTTIAAIKTLGLGEKVALKISQFVATHAIEAAYQFSGNVSASRHKPQLIEQAANIANELADELTARGA